jgi:lipopolysaccharide transport system permease protein
VVSLPVTIVGPESPPLSAEVRELVEHRDLLWFLAWRDVKVRYKQTALGIAWALIQPLFAMLVFSIFLGHLVRVPSDGLPYPLFSYAALLPWSLFAAALGEASASLVANRALLTKVYFPRLVLPLAAVFVAVIDFAVAAGLLVALMLWYGVVPGLGILLAPFFVLVALASALGAGLWLGALNVQYRDVRYVVPFLVQVWFYATPVVYPSSLLPAPWRALYGLNPMAGAIEGFRSAVLGGRVEPALAAVSAVAAAALLWGGVRYFRRVEDSFADLA